MDDRASFPHGEYEDEPTATAATAAAEPTAEREPTAHSTTAAAAAKAKAATAAATAATTAATAAAAAATAAAAAATAAAAAATVAADAAAAAADAATATAAVAEAAETTAAAVAHAAEAEADAVVDAADAAESDRMDGIDESGPQGQGVGLYSDDEEDRTQQENMAPIPNPPDNQEFESFAAAEEELISFSRRHGFELTKYGSVAKDLAGNVLRRPYRCAKGISKSGLIRYRAEKDAQGLPEERKRPSKKTGCPFSATIHAMEKDNPEGLYTIVLGRNPMHNHPAINAIALASHRRASRTQIRQFLRNARDSQTEPRKICAMAQREFAEKHGGEMVAPVLRDIRNEWAKIRSETM